MLASSVIRESVLHSVLCEGGGSWIVCRLNNTLRTLHGLSSWAMCGYVWKKACDSVWWWHEVNKPARHGCWAKLVKQQVAQLMAGLGRHKPLGSQRVNHVH